MKIFIKNLRARAKIGVYSFEKHQKQDIIFNIELTIDASKSKQSDDLCDTIDYCKLSSDIVKLTEDSNFELIERLMSEVLAIIKATDKAKSASVEIIKPAALANYSAIVSIQDGF